MPGSLPLPASAFVSNERPRFRLDEFASGLGARLNIIDLHGGPLPVINLDINGYIDLLNLLRDFDAWGWLGRNGLKPDIMPGVPEVCYRIPPHVLEAIASERVYQMRKWPGHKHTAAEWVLILQKLVRDAERQWVTGHGDGSVLDEIRQIGATAVAAMEEHKAPKRNSSVLDKEVGARAIAKADRKEVMSNDEYAALVELARAGLGKP